MLTTLPDGGCLVYMYNQVLRFDKGGKTIPSLYKCDRDITGILHSQDFVYVIGREGTITKHSLCELTQVVQMYKFDTVGALYRGDLLDEQTLLLLDHEYRKVFTYNMTTEVREVKITGLKSPVSVVCRRDKSRTLLAVCERDAHQVSLYNDSRKLLKVIGGFGRTDGRMKNPGACIFTPWGTLLVCDSQNNRISEYSIPNGKFIRHVMTSIYNPYSMCYSHPYLWITHVDPAGARQVKRFKLFQQ